VNLPVPPGSGGETFLSLVEHVVVPVAREHRPGVLFVSAGYDAHRDDPLAQCELGSGDYRSLAAAVARLAAELEVPVVVCLEGGYALEALGESVAETVAGLGSGESPPEAPVEPAAELRARHSAHWPVLAG
jgi:acetoin utilization deacetylase AcuC-like enzyme